MATKKYANLVKPVLFGKGPQNLYPDPVIWMEGKDMEGFEANIAYTFIQEPTTLHPVEGTIIHPYDEVLVFGGLDPKDILYLGGEVSIELGEEREEYIFAEPSVVCIPKGLPHGPVKVRRVTVPFAHYAVGLSPEYKATAVTLKEKGPESYGTKYEHLVKRLRTYVAPLKVDADADDSGMGYLYVTDEKGIMHPAERGIGPGNGDEIIWMFGDDLNGFEVNLTWGHYSKCGKWHRAGETHTHPEAEVLCFVAGDASQPDLLGAELEFALGAERERHVYSTPTYVVCPKGFPHLPLITRWCDQPYIFFVICLSGQHDSPWVEVEEV